MKDLFEYPEEQPEELKAILSKYEDQEQDYNTCKALLSEVQAIGYTFEYYLDAVPFDLRKLEEADLYNGKTIEQINDCIENSHLIADHKALYMRNVQNVIQYQQSKTNLHLIEGMKAENNRLWKLGHPNLENC